MEEVPRCVGVPFSPSSQAFCWPCSFCPWQAARRGGDQGQAIAPSAPSPRVERQAIDNLLALYQEAVVAEDSDRLSALLAPATALVPGQPTAVPRQDPPGAVADPGVLQATLHTTFQQTTVTALAIPPETVVLAPDSEQRHLSGGRKHPRPGDSGTAHPRVSHHLGAQPGGHGGSAPGDQRRQSPWGRWSRSRQRACWWRGHPSR